jgi:hypothetical protein
LTVFKFKQIVSRGGADKYAAIATDGSLWETVIDLNDRRPKWQQLGTGDMKLPVTSLAARGETLLAVDGQGQAWRQGNDGSLASRSVYQWNRLDFEVAVP